MDWYQKPIYHLSSVALAVAFPVGLLAAPSELSAFCDGIISVAVPVHGYLGMQLVVTDYVPGHDNQAFLLTVLKVLCVLLFLAFAYKSSSPVGAGLTGSIQQLWRKPKKESH